jgi:hypothetical protein
MLLLDSELLFGFRVVMCGQATQLDFYMKSAIFHLLTEMGVAANFRP